MESHECVTPHSKVCKSCGTEKENQSFYKRTNGNLFSSCKECCKKRDKENYQKSKDVKLAKCSEYRKANKQRIKEYHQAYYEANKDKMLSRAKEYRSNPEIAEKERIRQNKYYAERSVAIQAQRKAKMDNNPELRLKMREFCKSHYERKKHLYIAKCGKRRAAKVSATPAWANLNAIKAIYKQSMQISIETGIEHHVDHIIPLQGKTVSGLHVESNLQIIPAKQNLSKANKLEG